MISGNKHQRAIFEYLRTILPEGKSFAEEIGLVLFVSPDSAYRRIRGETPLTLDELKLICDHFSISADQLLQLQHPNRVVFESVQISSSSMSLRQYLSRVNEQMDFLRGDGYREIRYCSKDLPLFHFFVIPELMAFKFHFWQQVIAQDPAYRDRPFDMDSIDDESRDLCRQALEKYNAVPSVEIWNAESINTTLFQMVYLRQIGVITSDDLLRQLFDLMDGIIDHLETEAETGVKFLPGQNPQYMRRNFQLFHNQIALADTILLAQIDQRKIALLNYGILNYVSTEDPRFADSLERDLQNVIRRSTKLSEANERQRGKFFHALHGKIREQREALKT